MVKLLARATPPLMRRLGEVPERSVTGPVPSAVLALATTMF